MGSGHILKIRHCYFISRLYLFFQSLETWGARWAKRELEKFGEPLLGKAAE